MFHKMCACVCVCPIFTTHNRRIITQTQSLTIHPFILSLKELVEKNEKKNKRQPIYQNKKIKNYFE